MRGYLASHSSQPTSTQRTHKVRRYQRPAVCSLQRGTEMHAHARRTGFTPVADAAPATSAAPPVVEPARDHGLAHLCSCSSPSAPSCGSSALCPVPSPSNRHHRQAFSTAAPPKMSAPMKEHRTSDRAQEKRCALRASADGVCTPCTRPHSGWSGQLGVQLRSQPSGATLMECSTAGRCRASRLVAREVRLHGKSSLSRSPCS